MAPNGNQQETTTATTTVTTTVQSNLNRPLRGRFTYLLDGTHRRRRAISGQLSRRERRWDLLLSKVPRPSTHFEPSPFVFRIRDYIVEERLGAGSGGRVYLGKHEGTSEQAAIKVIEKADSRKDRKARKEAGVMRALEDHPNIVPLVDVVENPGSICIVMKYARGGDLFEYIGRNGALEPADAWRVFGQVVSAVAYAHSCGFIHRDVKPENIFLDMDGNALLGDWGYACSWSSFKKKRRPCGSLNYAASEIVCNKTYTGPEVDIFSLGGVLYTILTGRLPFGSTVNRATLQRVADGKWRVDSSLPAPVVEMLNRMFDPVSIRRATMMDVIRFVKEMQQIHCTPTTSPVTSPVLSARVDHSDFDDEELEIAKPMDIEQPSEAASTTLPTSSALPAAPTITVPAEDETEPQSPAVPPHSATIISSPRKADATTSSARALANTPKTTKLAHVLMVPKPSASMVYYPNTPTESNTNTSNSNINSSVVATVSNTNNESPTKVKAPEEEISEQLYQQEPEPESEIQQVSPRPNECCHTALLREVAAADACADYFARPAARTEA
eukprot:TRINITY_DN820_c0_g1_i1.p1 TRINITY_DN820_c0_g1~~TRINITY_DN820_c0_g1_i1.p1  ORF type:complete len:557 (-),score=101.12 TRINITY_DN820_c0_g1_i1:234-1904(-)